MLTVLHTAVTNGLLKDLIHHTTETSTNLTTSNKRKTIKNITANFQE
jgi:histone H3/H4